MQKIVLNRKVPLKASFEWLKRGFIIFREAPLQFIILTIGGTALSFLPLLGSFISPLLTARFALLASSIERKEKISMSNLLVNLFQNRTLLQLAYVNVLFGGLIMLTEHYVVTSSILLEFSLKTMVYLLVVMIIQTFFWVSPIICEYNRDVKLWEAMLLSFEASMYNVAVMFLYGLLIVTFVLGSVVTLGIGLFVLIPVINVSNYFIYKSFFVIENK